MNRTTDAAKNFFKMDRNKLKTVQSVRQKHWEGRERKSHLALGTKNSVNFISLKHKQNRKGSSKSVDSPRREFVRQKW